MSIRRITLLLLGVIMLTVLGLSSTGCDRQVNISGKVYEWLDPPARATSLIFHKEISPVGILKEDLPEGLELQPLPGVKISAYGEYKAEVFYSNEITDEQGQYRLMISLGQKTDSYETTIEATRDGFMAVKRKITDVGDNHFINIILVPDTLSSEEAGEAEYEIQE